MSQLGYLSQTTQPVVIANTTVGSSYVEVSATVNLGTYNADSIMIVGLANQVAGAGFTMTAIGGASTSALGGYCTAAGSTSSLLTAATTTSGKLVFIDIKNARHKYVGVKHTGSGAAAVTILGFPYNTKTQPVPLSTDLSSTVSGTGFHRSVSPTTA